MQEIVEEEVEDGAAGPDTAGGTGPRLTCLAQQSRISRQAVALKRLVACAVLAARHRGALAAAASRPANAAATLARRLAVASGAVAALAAAGCSRRKQKQRVIGRIVDHESTILTYARCRRVHPSRACKCTRRACCRCRAGSPAGGCTCRTAPRCIRCGSDTLPDAGSSHSWDHSLAGTWAPGRDPPASRAGTSRLPSRRTCSASSSCTSAASRRPAREDEARGDESGVRGGVEEVWLLTRCFQSGMFAFILMLLVWRASKLRRSASWPPGKVLTITTASSVIVWTPCNRGHMMICERSV